MFQKIRIRGAAAALLRGHQTAAEIRTWSIVKAEAGGWTLTATLARVDAFHVRQKGLLFVAPRAGGYWAWSVESVRVGGGTLVAVLGPPEQ